MIVQLLLTNLKTAEAQGRKVGAEIKRIFGQFFCWYLLVTNLPHNIVYRYFLPTATLLHYSIFLIHYSKFKF